MGGRDRTHVWTCVDVSVRVLIPQLGSGREAELGSDGQAGLGGCLGAEREIGTGGLSGVCRLGASTPGSRRDPRPGWRGVEGRGAGSKQLRPSLLPAGSVPPLLPCLSQSPF